MNRPMFDDLLQANRRYSDSYVDSGLSGIARRGLAVLTCIDTRIDPLAMLGLRPGDAKILRNAGARVTPDSLRSLILAVHLLQVSRIAIVQHTDCAMAGSTDEDIRRRIEANGSFDAAGFAFHAMPDQSEALGKDVKLLRDCPLIPASVEVGTFLLDVRTGRLTELA